MLAIQKKALDVQCHLAVALSTSVNAVSKLNADVAMTMFDEQVIQPITNGVHHITWTSPVMASYFDQHPEWMEDAT